MCCHPAFMLSYLCVRNEATTGGQFTKLDRPTGLLSIFLLLSPYKTIAFHNATKGGFLGGRIVINILLMHNQILYDNKQPSAML